MRVPTRSRPEYLSLAFWLPSFPRCHTRLSVVRNGSMSRLGHVDYGNTLFDDAVAASSKRRHIKLTSVHRRLPHQTSAEVRTSFRNLCAAKQTLGLHIPATEPCTVYNSQRAPSAIRPKYPKNERGTKAPHSSKSEP